MTPLPPTDRTHFLHHPFHTLSCPVDSSILINWKSPFMNLGVSGVFIFYHLYILVDWLFRVYWPFETVFHSISGRLPMRGRKKREIIDERKNAQNTPPAPTASAIGPCSTAIQTSRTPRYWKFTQHHRTTRLLPIIFIDIAVDYMQIVKTLIRRRVSRRLIWVCTISLCVSVFIGRYGLMDWL